LSFLFILKLVTKFLAFSKKLISSLFFHRLINFVFLILKILVFHLKIEVFTIFLANVVYLTSAIRNGFWDFSLMNIKIMLKIKTSINRRLPFTVGILIIILIFLRLPSFNIVPPFLISIFMRLHITLRKILTHLLTIYQCFHLYLLLGAEFCP